MKKEKFIRHAVEDLPKIRFPKINRNPNTKAYEFTDRQIEDIVKRARRGESITYISKRYGCSKKVIAKVVKEGRAGEKLPESIKRKG